jgi:hypothetical protein
VKNKLACYMKWLVNLGEIEMIKLDVLVLCECSGEVSRAFRKRGHNAYSNDIQEADHSQDRPYHIVGDCIDVLQRNGRWDIIIMHPPCTAIAVSGNRWYGVGMPRFQERLEALSWTQELWLLAKAKADHVALENPVGTLNTFKAVDIKPHYVQPYWFGHPESKRTGLWLHNLPRLVPINDVRETMDSLPMAEKQRIWYMSPSSERAKLRSMTYPGLAAAMADQWGSYVLSQEKSSC